MQKSMMDPGLLGFFFISLPLVYIVFRHEKVARRVGSLQEEACLLMCGRQSQHPHRASLLLIHLHLFSTDAPRECHTAKCKSGVGGAASARNHT